MSDMRLIEDMCAAVPAPERERLAAIKERVLDGARQAALPGGPSRRGRAARRAGRARGFGVGGWPRLAWTGAIAIAVAVIVVAATLLSGGGAMVPPASAAVLLDHARAAALAQPTPTDKQLIYTDTRIYYATYGRHGGTPAGHVAVRQQEWQSPVSPAAFYRASPCDMNGYLRRGQATCSFQGGYAPGATRYSTYAGLKTLPTSPGKLLAYLAALPAPAGYGRSAREWSGANLIAELDPVLPPAFGAALFRAIAEIPGTTLLASTTNAAGAHGIGVSRSVGGLAEELIFDPSTYRLIGQQYTVLARAGLARDGSSAAGYVTSATALIQTRFVGAGSGSGEHGPGQGSGTSPRDGQFIYTNTMIITRSPEPARAGRAPRFAILRGSEQKWQSVDGLRPGAFGMTPCHATRATCLILIPPGPESPALTTYAGLRALPTSPGALSSYLREHPTCPAAGQAGSHAARLGADASEWNTVTVILGDNLVLPPGLGKALFEVASRIGGDVVGSVTDAAGGHGIAVARNSSRLARMELIFAPGSYRFIGVQVVLVRPMAGLRAGTVWAASSVASARIVNTAPVTALNTVFEPASCGYMPGYEAFGSSGSGSSGSGSSGSGSSGSGSSG
jgi:hypothetical protein